MDEHRRGRVWGTILACAGADGAAPSTRHALLACAVAMNATDVGLTMIRAAGPSEPVLSVGVRCDELEELQLTLGQGPALDAAAGDRPVFVADLADIAATQRWPVFARGAVAVGVRAMLAFPVAAGGARIGVLDVYRDRPGLPAGDRLADGLAYADAVLALALDERGGVRATTGLVTQGELPARRAEVHQAAGMVSVQLGVGVDEALARLRGLRLCSRPAPRRRGRCRGGATPAFRPRR